MTEKLTDFYKLEFYDSYVVVEGKSNISVNSSMAENIIKNIFDHFKDRKFVIVSNRIADYEIQLDAYSSSIFKKVKGIAIVSKNAEVRDKAILEQQKFNGSFAFFDNLDDAKNWAENFFSNY